MPIVFLRRHRHSKLTRTMPYPVFVMDFPCLPLPDPERSKLGEYPVSFLEKRRLLCEFGSFIACRHKCSRACSRRSIQKKKKGKEHRRNFGSRGVPSVTCRTTSCLSAVGQPCSWRLECVYRGGSGALWSSDVAGLQHGGELYRSAAQESRWDNRDYSE